jgi:L-ascorbate metabolism protein UlaG (beta-lactamase superfamily)
MLDRFVWYKQSAYRWKGDDRTIYIDPWEVTGEPEPADAIFLTHAHFDHYSPDDIGKLRTPDTVIVAPRDIAAELTGNVQGVGPGDTFEAAGIKGETVPAYNTVEHRLQSHPQANDWVGYLLDLGGVWHYHAGDTDALPELEGLRAQVAFVPIGGGDFTMDPAEAAGLVKKISPEVAVPMHYGFVAGPPSLAEEFRTAAAPVAVEILTPEREFEQTEG